MRETLVPGGCSVRSCVEYQLNQDVGLRREQQVAALIERAGFSMAATDSHHGWENRPGAPQCPESDSRMSAVAPRSRIRLIADHWQSDNLRCRMAMPKVPRQLPAVSQSPNAVAPQAVASLLALATELLRAGRPADAITPLRDAALLDPSNPAIQHDLGLACLEVGRVPESIAALQRAVACNPRYADAYFRLGIAFEKLGNTGGAIVAYNRATELLPSLTEAWFRAGALVETLGHRDEAIGCFRRAAATGSKTSFGRLGKARALLIEDRNQEAEQVLRHTLALDPGNSLAHDLLGNLLSEFGRFDEAREYFQRAIAIAPLLAGCYYDLVRCRTITSDDEELLERMRAALNTPGLEASQRLRLHLAIGKAADDLGDYAPCHAAFRRRR